MDINDYRKTIDETDAQIVELFKKRMQAAEGIAAYKKENSLPVYDGERERKLMTRVSELAGEQYEGYTRVLFSTLLNLSRSYQLKKLNPPSALAEKLREAIASTPALFPEKATVACQGVEGAYSQQACEKLFAVPDIMYFSNFDAVFKAVGSGLCRYGILPLENSTAGSVNKVYDLMSKYKFSIVRSVRCRISHKLLARPGVKLSDIKEIVSHEQAISQCSQFLAAHKDIKVTFCENTAVAAKTVAASSRTDLAAISSSACAGLYGLRVLESDVRDEGANDTRFICISKTPEVYPGSDRTSIKLTLPHHPGALYHILARFYVQGINIVKLESRPIPGSDFEFMFYFDAAASVASPSLSELLCELENEADDLEYLGSYTEIV